MQYFLHTTLLEES